jgi:hypothetical protein
VYRFPTNGLSMRPTCQAVSLPAGLDNTGQFSLGSEVPKADAANSKFSQVTPRTSADGAAIVGAHFKFRFTQCFIHQ